jgi:hypothetical protein
MKRYSLLTFLTILILLSACQSIPVTAMPNASIGDYPSEGQDASSNNGYPIPERIAPTDVAYPAPSSLPILAAGELPVPPTETLIPERGKAALTGVLYSYTIKAVIPETQIYLTPAVGNNLDQVPLALVGPQDSRGDIVATTDENGYILMNNIPPGNYFLIVWAPLNYSIVETADMIQTPLLIQLKTDEIFELGVTYLSWP